MKFLLDLSLVVFQVEVLVGSQMLFGFVVWVWLLLGFIDFCIVWLNSWISSCRLFDVIDQWAIYFVRSGVNSFVLIQLN